MRLKPLLIPLALAGCAGLAVQTAVAGPSGFPEPMPTYSAGAIMVRIGAAYVEPDEDVYSGVQSFIVDDPATDSVVEQVPVDVLTTVSLDDATTWYISAVWVPIEHFGVELYHYNDAGHDATLFSRATTTGDFIGDFSANIGDFDSYTTSLFANWYPLDPNCLIQPYVGLGAAYVDIEEDFVRNVFNDDGFRHGVLGFGSDFSWTAQIGVDFNFGPGSAWQVNASAMYVDAQPELSLGYDTETSLASFADPLNQPAILPVRIRDDMDFDPWMFNLGIGYKFSF